MLASREKSAPKLEKGAIAFDFTNYLLKDEGSVKYYKITSMLFYQEFSFSEAKMSL
jgi:hypothetical protein